MVKKFVLNQEDHSLHAKREHFSARQLFAFFATIIFVHMVCRKIIVNHDLNNRATIFLVQNHICVCVFVCVCVCGVGVLYFYFVNMAVT